MTNTKCRIDTVISADDFFIIYLFTAIGLLPSGSGWAHSHPKHVEKRNKCEKKNCAPSWFYLQDYTVSLLSVFPLHGILY